MKALFLAVSLVLAALPAFSKVWTVADASLEVRFDDATALLTVLDKRCNKLWEQSSLQNKFTVDKISRNGNTLTLSVKGAYSFNVMIALTPASALELTLSAAEKAPMEELAFPSAFKAPDRNHYLLYTDGEGFLLPVNDTAYPIGRNRMYSMSGLAMPWMGITDTALKTGYMAILETPDDCDVNVKREGGLITFEPVWLAQKGTFGYSRKVSYHFFSEGGYVAQCKAYREYVWKKNGSGITLAEKQKAFPAIEKLMGAVHIYLWDDGREAGLAKELKQSGIDKALVLWNPDHPPYPEAGFDNKIKDLGYLSGVYELFRDAHLNDTVGTISTTNTTGTWLNRFSFPGLFKKITLVQKDGSLHYSGFGYDINPKAVLPLIPALRTDRELKIYPHESFFLDGFMASGIYECYSKDNPLTRSQYKAAVIGMNNLFINKYKMIVGVEWGADYCVPTTVYAHGMTTLHRMLYKSADRRKQGTIYYVGNWRNPSRPSIILGRYVADKNYMKWTINEKIRVPLYQLVYHDAIITTWRWEDTNPQIPDLWWKKDLFNILYGTAPVWNLDRKWWEDYKVNFVESYRNICPWLQKIGYDELVSHRFVSDDRTVQETVFSSGKKAVVNFGDDDYLYNGKLVKGRGFLVE